MKTIALQGYYFKPIALQGEDYALFRRLLKGGISSNKLYIAPIELDTILLCKNFSIEHHQIVYSAADGQMYLVFRPLWNEEIKPRFTYYGVVESWYQDDYVELLYDFSASYLLPEDVYGFPVRTLSLPQIIAL